MRGELSKSGKKWPRYRLPKFADCPTFFYNPLCTLGIGLMAHKPVAAPVGTAVPRAVYTGVRSSGRCASCMRVYAPLIDPSLLAFILGTTATLFRKEKYPIF